MLLQSVSVLNLHRCIGLPAELRGRWLQRALSPRGGTNPVTSAFFLLRCHQQPIREHLNRDIKSRRREGGQQRTAYGGSRCPHNMTPTHSGLLDGTLINDDSPHSQTSSMPLTHMQQQHKGTRFSQSNIYFTESQMKQNVFSESTAFLFGVDHFTLDFLVLICDMNKTSKWS